MAAPRATKRTAAAKGFALALALVVGQAGLPASAVQLRRRLQEARASPVEKVVSLMAELKARITSDGELEQASYDKYACWCEETLGRKANDISSAKDQIEETEQLIVKLKAEVASHTAEIKKITEDIAANVKATHEATEVRDKDFAAYEEEKSESEQCVGALEAAIKVLAGAGSKKGFLETLQEAQLLSVVAGVRGVLEMSWAAKAVSGKDLELVRHFVARPEDFVGGRTGALSAAQLAGNPFGDYAPRSTQIQGILKGMYESFAADLERDNAKEAQGRKSFEELMETKAKERETLQAILDQHTLDEAKKTKTLAESQQIRDDTKEQLEADENFFADAKRGCQAKAGEWATRTRLRTEELEAIAQVVEILSSPEAKRTFENATSTFLQLASTNDRLAAASATLKRLATKYRSVRLARLAVAVRAGGHFDKVINAIDAMIEILRKEEKEDIEHRDRCQGAQQKSNNDMEDLDNTITKVGKKIDRMMDEEGDLAKEIATAAAAINKTMEGRAERKTLRITEYEDFKQALKDDVEAIALLEEAIAMLANFYKKSGTSTALVQKAEPVYSKDQAPDTAWSGDYNKRQGEGGGILAILQLIKEDLEKEVAMARSDDAEAQVMYEKDAAAMKESLDKQEALKTAKDKELSGVQLEVSDAEERKGAAEDGKVAEQQLQEALEKDCAWVQTHFDSRREKRKTETDGLVEAKSYLAGVDSGEEI